MRYQGPQIPFFIISASLSDLSPEQNGLRTKRLFEDLQHFQAHVKPVLGMYKNIPEASFLVFTETPHTLITHILGLASKYGQESILFVGERRNSVLYFVDPSEPVMYLGQWREVEETVARNHESFTKLGDRFFVAS